MTNILINSLLSVVYPPVCPCCSTVMTRGEGPLCLACRLKLPLTRFENSPADNDMTAKLQGLTPIESAVAYFHYRRSAPQAALIHDLKYRGCPTIGRDLAREYSEILRPKGFFDDIDALAPVPLNFWRHCRRGYNQSAWIARGIADVTSLPIIDALSARRHTSQTRHNAYERQASARGIYSAKPKSLTNIRHILLVDDICTSGSTLNACAEAIHGAAPDIRISAFALATTSLL